MVELLIAVAITGLIGMAIAAMMTAVSRGTEDGSDLRALVIERKRVAARLNSAIRESTAVLAVDTGVVVLWTRDLDEDGNPSLHELERIEHDAVTNQLDTWVVDPAVTDVAYTLTDDFLTITDTLILSGDLVSEAWSTRVEGLDLALDDATPTQARLLSYRVTLMRDEFRDTAIGAVALRNEASP